MFGMATNVLVLIVLATLSAGGLAYALMFGRIQNERSAEKYRACLQSNPSYVACEYNLAILRQNAGDLDAAVAGFRRPFQRHRTNVRFFGSRTEDLRQNEAEEPRPRRRSSRKVGGKVSSGYDRRPRREVGCDQPRGHL